MFYHSEKCFVYCLISSVCIMTIIGLFLSTVDSAVGLDLFSTFIGCLLLVLEQ